MSDTQEVDNNNGINAFNNYGEQIQNQTNIQNQINNYGDKDKNRQSIKNIKIDFYELRERMIGFVLAKVLIPSMLFLFFINLLIFKYNNSDTAFNSLGTTFISIISFIIFYYFNKYYYKDEKRKKELKEEKAEILFFIDLFFIAWMFYLNFM